MRINFAHLREHAASGGWINFAVFDAHSTAGTDPENAKVLASLTAKARSAGYRVDQAALAFLRGGRTTFYGTKTLVQYLSRMGVPHWTHVMDV